MPVPATIADLSTTAGSNYPQGSDTPTTGDDTFRALSSFIAQLRDQLNDTSNTGTLKNPVLSGTATGSGFVMPAHASGYISTPAVCGVSAYRSTNQTLVTGTNTIRFDTETADRAANYVTGTGVFTAPLAGLYQVNALLALQNNSASSATLTGVFISVNGAIAVGASTVYLDISGGTVNASSSAFTRAGSSMLSLALNDTLQVVVVHTGGNLTALAGSHFSVHYVG